MLFHLNNQTTGTLIVAASAAGFATLAIFVKFAYLAGANVITILTVRFLLAASFLGLILKMRNISMHVNKKLAIQLCLMGVIGYASMSALFASSLHYLPASLSAMVLYTYPALVSLLSFAVGDEDFSWSKGMALAVSFAGLFLVLGVSFADVQPVGIFLAIGAAVTYACYIVVGNRVLKNVDPLITTTYVCAAAAITFMITGFIMNNIIYTLPLQGWLAILGIAVFATLIGVLGFFAGMRRIGATNASIISTIEPVITVILSAILLEEKVTLTQAGGGVLILAGIIVLQIWAGHNSTYPAGHPTEEDGY